MILGLEEQNDELQAVVLTRGVEEGRFLLHNSTANSLAQELEEMTQTEVSFSLQLIICSISISTCYY